MVKKTRPGCGALETITTLGNHLITSSRFQSSGGFHPLDFLLLDILDRLVGRLIDQKMNQARANLFFFFLPATGPHSHNRANTHSLDGRKCRITETVTHVNSRAALPNN